MSHNPMEQTLSEIVLQIVKGQKPETVRELTNLVHQQVPSASDKDILDAVIQLQKEDKIRFTQKHLSLTDLKNYSIRRASWYWVTVVVTMAAAICVFTVQDVYPFVVIRYVLGAIFILWLPGYAFIKALFPIELPFKTSNRDLDTVERSVLSIGMSLALVPIVGLLLNYTPWGIRSTPITISLTALTLTFATVALIREYQSSRKFLSR